MEMLADGVHSNLMKHRFMFRTVTAIVRFEDFTTYTRAKTFSTWTSEINVNKKEAVELLSEFLGRKKFRLVGVGVTKLRERDEKQMLITDFA